MQTYYTTFLRHKETGEVYHEQNFTNSSNRGGYIWRNEALLRGEFNAFRVKTYRYIYPLCSKFAYKGKERVYPAYERGEIPFVWVRDAELIAKRITELKAQPRCR